MISHITGLDFEYEIVETVEEIITGNRDIICGIPENYVTEGKIYVVVIDSLLLQGVYKDKAVFF